MIIELARDIQELYTLPLLGPMNRTLYRSFVNRAGLQHLDVKDQLRHFLGVEVASPWGHYKIVQGFRHALPTRWSWRVAISQVQLPIRRVILELHFQHTGQASRLP